jgi:hypothetical protein
MGDLSSNVSVSCNPENLGELLAAMYLKMYPHQRGSNPFQGRSLISPEPGFGMTFNPPHYTQSGFAALLAFLNPRIMSDWPQTMAEFLGSLNTEYDFYGVPTHHIQDTCLQFYLAGTDPNIRRFKVNTGPSPSPHNVILSSAVTCVILTVPRRALQSIVTNYPIREERVNHRLNLFFRIHLASGKPKPGETLVDRMNRVQLYCSPIPMFGKLITASDGKTCTVEIDPLGWIGTSDLHISVLVPTRSLEIMREGSNPQIDLQLNPDNGSIPALGGFQNMDIYSAALFDRSKVKLVEALPGFSAPRPTFLQSPNYEWPLYDDTATPTQFNILDMTFSSRLTFRQEPNRLLLVSGAPVTIDSSTPCSVSVRCGSFLYQFLFPYPVIARRANIKVNRKAGWIEITIPLASDKEGGYIANRFPVRGQPDQLCNWNLPTVSFDILTRIDKITDDVSKWVIPHLDTILSKREFQLLTANPQVNVPAFTLFKKSIYDILCRLSRTPQTILSCIQANADDRERIYLVIDGLYLNDTTHSVVAEAFVLPYLPALEPPAIFEEQSGVTLVVGKEAFKIWKQALPSMVQSCRDWDHRSDCSMITSFPLRTGSGEGEVPICVCCTLNENPRGTPIAIFPIFGVPYLEELRDRTDIKWLAAEMEELEISVNGQSDLGTQIGGNVLCKCCQKVASKRCAKCNVKYCSKECQRQDWKRHKSVCVGTE